MRNALVRTTSISANCVLSNRQLVRIIELTVVILLCCTFSGCSDGRPKRVAVSGKVLLDGKPLTKGVVQFVPNDSRQSAGKLDENGNFTLSCYEQGDGVVLGAHRVVVISREVVNGTSIRWLAPPKYADVRKSDLSFEITEPTEDLVIELTWNGGKPFIQR